MNETLQRLKKEGHELYLHTGGDEPNQRRKITQLELATFFEHRVFISEHKDTTALKDIMKTEDFDPKITWMVRSSLKTDIMPALEVGINAMHIPPKTEWEYNVEEISVEPKGAFITLNSLNEVPEAIHNYIKEKDDEIPTVYPHSYEINNQQSGEGDNLFR
jgi:putative hydrolase of the HAD superfamily